MAKEVMTTEEYVDEIGYQCPVCRGHNLSTKSFDGDAGFVWQNVSCDDCGSTWKDVYTLSSMTDLKIGKKKMIEMFKSAVVFWKEQASRGEKIFYAILYAIMIACLITTIILFITGE